MLYFLTLKDEMTTDAIDHYQKQVGVSKNKFPSLLSDDEIQKVIFDDNYVTYIKNKDSQYQLNNKSMKLQYVQYECIKSELKEEYERKLNVLSKKFD